jgi:hypothetical protein
MLPSTLVLEYYIMWSICGNLQDGCFIINTGPRPAAWKVTAKGRAALCAAGLVYPEPAEAQEPSPPDPEDLPEPDDQPTPEQLEAERLAALYATPTKPYRPGGTYTPSPWHPARPDAYHANQVPSREGDRCTAYAGIKSQCVSHGQVLLAPSRLQQ